MRGEGGAITKDVEDAEAESLARMLVARLNREIRSDLGGLVAVSVKNPKSQESALVV